MPTVAPAGMWSVMSDSALFSAAALYLKLTFSKSSWPLATTVSGAAKTTLVQLIPRLYDATAGTVMVGGRDVRDYDLTALRDAVGIVLQKNLLFTGTIRENLQWGNPDATDEELWAACRAAHAVADDAQQVAAVKLFNSVGILILFPDTTGIGQSPALHRLAPPFLYRFSLL